MLRHIPARPEQTQFPNPLAIIVRHALHAAALAPTYQDALDVCGVALRSIAEISREEIEPRGTLDPAHRRDCLIRAIRATEAFKLTLATDTFEYEVISARIARLSAELLEVDTQAHSRAEVAHG